MKSKANWYVPRHFEGPGVDTCEEDEARLAALEKETKQRFRHFVVCGLELVSVVLDWARLHRSCSDGYDAQVGAFDNDE